MYDIEIIIPISGNFPYVKRLSDFKTTGLINVGEKKVLMTLLVGPDIIPNILKDWPQNVDVNVVSCEHTHLVSKVYSYFYNYGKNPKARWIAKIDDDTVNDISNWVDRLDLEYDHTRDYYIITELRSEMHWQEDSILRKIGFERWFNPKNVIWHELEGCVVSQSALSRILNDEAAMTFIKERYALADGYTDYALACAARIVKVYPIDCYFMSKDPFIGDLVVFGGQLTHIHNICHDKNGYAINMLKRMLSKDVGKKWDIHKFLVDKNFVYRSDNGLHEITLKESGIIEGDADVWIWHINIDGRLEFLGCDAQLISYFDDYSNLNSFTGKSHCMSQTPSLKRLA